MNSGGFFRSEKASNFPEAALSPIGFDQTKEWHGIRTFPHDEISDYSSVKFLTALKGPSWWGCFDDSIAAMTR
jgi:hypothetical protein